MEGLEHRVGGAHTEVPGLRPRGSEAESTTSRWLEWRYKGGSKDGVLVEKVLDVGLRVSMSILMKIWKIERQLLLGCV